MHLQSPSPFGLHDWMLVMAFFLGLRSWPSGVSEGGVHNIGLSFWPSKLNPRIVVIFEKKSGFKCIVFPDDGKVRQPLSPAERASVTQISPSDIVVDDLTGGKGPFHNFSFLVRLSAMASTTHCVSILGCMICPKPQLAEPKTGDTTSAAQTSARLISSIKKL
jgi:hypothetical protein